MGYCIGEVLHVKEWDDMVDEFGEECGVIRTPYYRFIENMRCICGKEFTVSDVTGTSMGTYRYYSREGVESLNNASGWYITEDMLEKKVKEYTPDEIERIIQ